MEELTKDQNDHIDTDTYKQFLSIRVSAIDRQVFDRQNWFQYSTKIFLLYSERTVIKLYKYENTSVRNYKV